MNNEKWKAKLVSSSLPLEYEILKALVLQGFAVNSDYTYQRDEQGILKDFSVDIEATAYFLNSNKITASLDLLIECKQRKKNTKWLFFPDPNLSDFSPITLGYTLRCIDEFSPTTLSTNVAIKFDKKFNACIKGIEIDINDGNVYDSELRHGIYQLKYALPRLLVKLSLHNIFSNHLNDNKPFLLCPILLTNAELFVAKREINVSLVENAEQLKDIAEPVPWLMLYSDYGPDFKMHCKRIFQNSLSGILSTQEVKNLDVLRKKHGEDDFMLPSSIFNSLIKCDRFTFSRYFTQFVICSKDRFSDFTKNIKQISSGAIKKKKVEKM
ncbi:MAG: hypothetical protein DRP78_00960 [Candidatus Omnitrophota bacterium]|nr:MAG: hypothetical protein DRP78_00960 [Candidatus Omnitrophota bacterium]